MAVHISFGHRNDSSSGSTRCWNPGSAAARCINSAYAYSEPRAAQESRQQRTIQRPITFFSRRVVPFTPPSLLKLRRMAFGDSTGASSSVPTSDQVPELMNAVPSRADIAATADPVSCDAGAIIGVPDRRVLGAISGNRAPTRDPGSTIGPGKRDGKPRRSIKSVAQVRETASTICVVVAFVNSHIAFPVIQ